MLRDRKIVFFHFGVHLSKGSMGTGNRCRAKKPKRQWEKTEANTTMNSSIYLNKEHNMAVRKFRHLLLILPLLVSAVSLSPAQAAGPTLTDASDTKVIWCPATVSLPTPSENGCANRS